MDNSAALFCRGWTRSFAKIVPLAFAFLVAGFANGSPAFADSSAFANKAKTNAGIMAGSSKTQSKVVLELFTSQGCSSCPKADALFPSFIARKDVIAISLSIDYWDYLGWRDTFGQAVFTARQKSYGRRIGEGMIYTPQIVVDGQYHANGSDEKAIDALIERRKKAKRENPGVSLELMTKDGMLQVSIGEDPRGGKVENATLWMALFSKDEKVKIRRGENRGRVLNYHNVVRELTPVGRWSGQKMVLKLPKKAIMQRGSDGCAFLLQKGEGGPIVAAVEMPNW